MDMRGRRAAAAADDIDKTRLRELADERGHIFGALVIKTELVRQAGVGIGADERIGDPGKFGEMGAHLAGAKRAVEADRQGFGVAQRIPERRRRLAGQRAAGEIRDRPRDHDRQTLAALLKNAVNGKQRRLGVERVEDCLDDQKIGAAFDQRVGRFSIGRAQIVEAHRAKARIVDVGRNRGGAVGRPQGAGDEAATSILLFRRVGRLAGEPRRGEIQFGDKLLHAVIGLRDPRRAECIRFDDVGAGFEIGKMNGSDRFRLGEAQEIIVAAQVTRPIGEARRRENRLR